MKYVLDTNSVSALLKGEPGSVARLKSIAPSSVAVPQPVIAKIRFGLERLPNSKRKAHLVERWALFERHLPRVTWTDEVSSSLRVSRRGFNAAAIQ